MTNYTAAIIIIGDEILSGRTTDTNTQYIANALSEIGINLIEVRIIGDDRSTIIKTVLKLSARYNYVFTTGGIGPTHDDITSEAISTAFGLKYVCNDKAYEILERGYALRGEKMNNNRAKMAYMPEGSELIIPDVGAPGYIVKNVFVLAGVPEIMCSMMQSVLPLLKKGKVVKSKHIEIMVGESAVAGEFQRLQNKYPQISMGSYPFQKDGKHGTSLVLRSNDYKSLEIAYQELEKMLHKNFY